MGTSLWVLIYRFVDIDIVSIISGGWFLYVICIAWIVALLLLSAAVMLTMRDPNIYKERYRDPTTFLPLKTFIVISPFFIVLVSWLIPVVSFYVGKKGL